jgi:hypothetical protein
MSGFFKRRSECEKVGKKGAEMSQNASKCIEMQVAKILIMLILCDLRGFVQRT